MILYWSSVAAMLIAIVGCGYVVTAMILVRRVARTPSTSRPAATPSVTILKPLYGNEPGLFDNLASFCRQDYKGAIHIICGVSDANDGAVAVFKRLQTSFATRYLTLVIDATSHGSNHKVSSLANMAPRIHHDVVIVSDSDMRVGPDYVARVIAALETPPAGAVTCLYYGDPATGIWARLSALAINAHFLPNVVVGLALGLARPCFGSTVALRRETLVEIGGFKAFADELADDYAIGDALRRQGRTIAVPPFAIAHRCTDSSAHEWWEHELRWARTIRSIDPVGYAGSIIAHPVAWALMATLLGAGSILFLPALVLTFAAVACRVALLRRVARVFDLPPQDYRLVPARDLLSFVIFIWSFFGRDVRWRGHRHQALPGRSAGVGSPQQ